MERIYFNLLIHLIHPTLRGIQESLIRFYYNTLCPTGNFGKQNDDIIDLKIVA